MMKRRARVVAASIGAIAICASLIAGSTYALFTSHSQVDVTVSSGKVSVTSWVSDITPITENKYAVASGEVIDGVLTVSNLFPGEGLSFKVNVENGSTAAVLYRTKIECVGGFALMNGLAWNVDDGEDLHNVRSYATGWATLPADGTKVPVTLSLPVDAGNEYQNLQTSIRVSVEAVQGNAAGYTPGVPEGKYMPDVMFLEAKSVEALEALVADWEEGEALNVALEADVQLTQQLNVKGDLNIIGNGAKLIAPANGTRVINVQELADPVTITLKGIEIESDKERGISLYDTKDVVLNIEDCTISADHYAVNVASMNENAKIIVKNSTLIGYCAAQSWSPNTEMSFEDSHLVGLNKWSGPTDDFSIIVLVSGATDSKLTFKNCVIEAVEQGTATETLLRFATNADVTCNGCKFVKNGVAITEVSELKTHLTANDGSVDFELYLDGEKVDLED